MFSRSVKIFLVGVLSILALSVSTSTAGATAASGDDRGTPVASRQALLLNSIFEARVIRLTNKRRAAAGCPPLRLNPALRRAARDHSTLMARAGDMSHELPGELGLVQRILRAGYTRSWRRIAENIAVGFSTPANVMRAWMASPDHRRNILDCRLREIGVGVIVDGLELWWTQDFGRS
jgi:uncharacterized protein YkwD